MDEYFAASIVEYEVVSEEDELLPALLVFKERDKEFSQLLLYDNYIQKLFTMQLRHKIGNDAKGEYPVQLGMDQIVRGLKNRARFAIQQKARLGIHANTLHRLN